MKKQVVQALVVTDDDISAHCLVQLMHLAWERGGSAHRRSGLSLVWSLADNALEEFMLPTTDAYTSFSEPTVRGALTNAHRKEINGRLQITANGRSSGIRLLRGSPIVPFDVRIRMVHAHYFADHRVNAAKVFSDLLTKKSTDDEDATDFVVLGVTDASLEQQSHKDIGSGVDQILTPTLLAEVAADLPKKLRVGLAITGLERDFNDFDVADPRWSTKYQSVHDAAWDPNLIRYMLNLVLQQRPHLRHLMMSDEGFRPYTDWPIAVTAVMPGGFMTDWNSTNYSAWDPGWVEGSPAIRGERHAPYVVPYCCADPLITLLTGMITEFQMTRKNMWSTIPPGPRQPPASSPPARQWRS